MLLVREGDMKALPLWPQQNTNPKTATEHDDKD